MSNKTQSQNSPPIEDERVKEELKKLVIARLRTIPEDLHLSIGEREFSKTDAIDHVRVGDAVGEHIMELQLAFLQDLATGKIYDNEKDNSGN